MYITDSKGNRYISEQLHFHWGGGPSGVSGSEHTVDGIRRVMEVCDDPDRVPFPSISIVTFLFMTVLHRCHVCAHACEGACARVWRPGVDIVFLYHTLTWFLKQALSLSLDPIS